MNPNNRHRETVRLMGIFHFVYAGMVILGSFFPLLWLTLAGLWWPDLAEEMQRSGDGWPVALTGSVTFVLAGFAILFALVWAALLIFAGRSLLNQTHHTLCLVVAALVCLAVPLGTALGIATLVVINREETRELFEA